MNTQTNSQVLNKIYNNLIDYVSVIKESNDLKPDWATGFVNDCQTGDYEFAYLYKTLKAGLISQFGKKETNEVILPEIIWANDLAEFVN